MKRAKQKSLLVAYTIIVIAASGIFFLVKANSAPGKFDAFAQCIKDKGAMFYGAFWCPHCQNQKALFGKSARLLPYHECSAPDASSQLPECNDKKIESYPTWEFADGSRETGEVTLQKLSEKTGCALPK